jgi:uncharacterized membrane protein YhaH (DUF805 family)
MKGNVIGFDPDTNTGAISGHDGRRYDFATADWHSHDRPPRHGDLVDFAPDGQRATQIYALEAAYVAPTFGQFLFSARGRISRSQFWLKWFLPIFVIGVILFVVTYASAASGSVESTSVMGLVLLVYSLIVLWPNIAVLVKRIHDSNKSGWLVLAFYAPWLLQNILTYTAGQQNPATILVGLVVFVVAVWFFIDFGCMRGTIGENQYGPDPVPHR